MRRLAGVLLALSVAGCAHTPPPSAGDVAALGACRQRADEIYTKQNRAELYNADTFATSGRDSPFAMGTVADLPSRGLSGEYERDNLVSSCLAGAGAASTGAASTGAAGAVAPRATATPNSAAPPPPAP